MDENGASLDLSPPAPVDVYWLSVSTSCAPPCPPPPFSFSTLIQQVVKDCLELDDLQLQITSHRVVPVILPCEKRI